MNEINYLVPSVFVGLLLIYDGVLLQRLKFTSKPAGIPLLVSSIEFVWACFTFAALLFMDFSRWYVAAPAIFAAHNVFGWVFGFLLIARGDISLDTNEPVVIPDWYVRISTGVGTVYAVLSAVAAFQVLTG